MTLFSRFTVAAILAATSLCGGCDDASTPTPDLGSADGGSLALRSCGADLTFKPGRSVTKVGIGGDWNGFHPDMTPMTGPDSTGTYRAHIDLATGVYAYKVVVYDGTTPTWSTDPANPYSKFVQGTENSALEVTDCKVPQLRFERLDRSPDGAMSGAVTYVDGNAAAGIGSVTATLDGKPFAISTDGAGDITFSTMGLAKGKHRLTVKATDNAMHAADDLDVPFWIEDESFDFRDGLLYFAFTDRFKNGDTSNDVMTPNVEDRANYDGGDFAGIAERITAGYFDQMGVRMIWISPPNANPEAGYPGTDGRQYTGYHGYWPSAGRATQPRFGSLDDLRNLITVAHQHGIRIIIDSVLNHVHKENPIYMQHKADGWFNGDGSCVCGAANCDWDTFRLVCWFTDYLPDMNYQSWDATETMIGDALWWARELDVDGFRVDAVKHFEVAATRRLRGKLREQLEHAGASYYLVGETFTGGDDGGRQYIKTFINDNELNAQFDFPTYWAMLGAFAQYSSTLRDLEAAANATDATFGDTPMSPFFGNHDVARFLTTAAGMLGGDAGQPWSAPPVAAPADSAGYIKLRLALTYLATQPGVPLLYYGDEIGMPGASDPDNRRRMKWDSLSADEAATLAHAQKVGKARRELRALRRGTRTTAWVDNDFYVYARSIAAAPAAPAEVAIVAINRAWTDRTQSVMVPAGISLPDGTVLTDRISGTKVTVAGGQIPLVLPAHESMILAP